jgi:hypothetical protein
MTFRFLASLFVLAALVGCSSPEEGVADLARGEEEGAVAPAEVLAPPGDLTPARDLDVADSPFSCRHPVGAHLVANAPDETFDLGPYLMVPTHDSITIKWRTLEAQDGSVLYGLDDTTDLEVAEAASGTIHRVELTGLVPDTRYAYRVRSGDRTSKLHHFYTAPMPGGSFTFVAWGDNQGGEAFPLVVSAVIDEAPHIALGLGDHVHDGRIDALWKDHLFDPARALFHEVPWYAAYGNHGKNGKLYYDLMEYQNLSVSPKWESVYSYTYGNAFFIVIDTNGLFFSIGDVDTDWSAWIKEQMVSEAAMNATWRIIYGHEPGAPDEHSVASPCGGYEGTVNSGVRAWLLPEMNLHGFHAYFSGHVHIYERTMVGNVLHIIAAGGGGGLENCELETDKSVKANRYHFIKGTAGCDALRIEAIDTNGEVFDFVELGPEPGTILDQGPFPANL